jgi:hypothetical protein
LGQALLNRFYVLVEFEAEANRFGKLLIGQIEQTYVVAAECVVVRRIELIVGQEIVVVAQARQAGHLAVVLYSRTNERTTVRRMKSKASGPLTNLDYDVVDANNVLWLGELPAVLRLFVKIELELNDHEQVSLDRLDQADVSQVAEQENRVRRLFI